VGGGQLAGAVHDTGMISNIDAGWTIIGNVICSTTTFGTPADITSGIEIAMRDFTISANVIYGVSAYGIVLDGNGTGNGSVTANTIFNVATGMACGPYAGHAVDHVVFNGNSVHCSAYAFTTQTSHTYIALKNNLLSGGTQSIAGTPGTGTQVELNMVDRRADAYALTVTASPMIYTAGYTDEMIAIMGYTTLVVTWLGSGLAIANDSVANSNWSWMLRPGDIIHISYTGTPAITIVPQD
jgi:hypothetical protein